MLINAIAVIPQAITSLFFLIRYSIVCKWWKTVPGRMLAGLVTCLFTITFTMVLTGSNEGLGSSPIGVTAGRLGFTVVMIYGIIALELKNRKRKKEREVVKAAENLLEKDEKIRKDDQNR